jgi:hypothetical protein
MAPIERRAMWVMIQRMLAIPIIQPSDSEYQAPMFMVCKKTDLKLENLTDDELEQCFRMVQDCRALNDVSATIGGPTMNPD